MFDIIVREAASRFGLGDKAATLVQTAVAYVINKDTGGIAGLVQRFRDAGLGEIAQSWVSGGTQAQAMTTEQSEVMFGQKGGLLDMVTSKLGISREVAMPALAYILPSVIGKLTPNGSIPTRVPDEVHQFVGAGAASDIVDRAHGNGAADNSGMWKWLALLVAGALAVLLLLKCSDTDTAELPSENIAPVETVSGAVAEAAGSVAETAGDVVDGAVSAAEQAGDAAGSAVTDAVEGAAEAAKDVGSAAGDAAEAAVEGAAGAAEKAGDAVDGAAEAAKKVGAAAGEAGEAVVQGAAEAVEKTGEAAKTAVEGAGEAAAKAADTAAAKTGEAVSAAADAASAAKDAASDAIASLFVDTSKDVVKRQSEDRKVQLAERAGVPLMKVFFDTGKHDVSAAFAELSADVVKHLAEHENARVVLQGFNDPRGDAAVNAELSKKRAQAVRDALVKQGVAAERVELRKPNSTVPEGGSYDEMRRVEVTVQE